MVDVFEQVEEEMRAERWQALVRRWWPWAAGVLGLILAIVLGIWGVDAWRTHTAGEASLAYNRGLEALQEQDLAAARSAFEEAADAGSGPYRALALMQQAGIHVQENETDEAVALFDQAARASGDPLIADSARLKAAFLVMDTGTLEEITERLDPLVEEGRPFRVIAQEALALAQLEHGQTDAARETFVLLTLAQDVPDALRQRAQAAISMIDADNAGAVAAIARAARELPAPTEAAVAPGGAGGPPAAE